MKSTHRIHDTVTTRLYKESFSRSVQCSSAIILAHWNTGSKQQQKLYSVPSWKSKWPRSGIFKCPSSAVLPNDRQSDNICDWERASYQTGSQRGIQRSGLDFPNNLISSEPAPWDQHSIRRAAPLGGLMSQWLFHCWNKIPDTSS